MFETLFTYPGVLRRHREGPLAAECAAYLSELADRGMAHGTILRQSSYCLCIALALQRWPPDRCFDEAEVELLAEEWAAQCGAGAGLRIEPAVAQGAIPVRGEGLPPAPRLTGASSGRGARSVRRRSWTTSLPHSRKGVGHRS